MALVSAAVIVVLFAVRTAREDRMLRDEPPGNGDHLDRVGYRRVLGVW